MMNTDSRFLKINDTKVDIDEKTAIGIDLQSYDLKKPGQKHINISNSFTIPETVKNRNIYGNIGDPQSESKKAYGINICNYWVDNEQLIKDAKVRLQESQDRIENFIFEKADFWDEIKKADWPTFASELLTWLQDEKGLPSETTPYTGFPEGFMTLYNNTTEGVLLPLFMGSMADYKSKGQNLIASNVINKTGTAFPAYITYTVTSDIAPITEQILVADYLSEDVLAEAVAYAMNEKWGNSNYVARSIGNGIEVTSLKGVSDDNFNLAISGNFIQNYPTSALVQEGIPEGTAPLEQVFDPPLPPNVEASIFLKQVTPNENVAGGHYCVYVRAIFEFIEYRYNVNFLTSGGVLPGNVWDDIIAQKLYMPIRDFEVHLEAANNYFFFRSDATFGISDNLKDKPAKTVYNFVNSFMQEMNILKDELFVNGENVIRLARFDDLENIAEVVDFSDRISGRSKVKPYIEGYGQQNRIKFKEVYPDGDELINSKVLTCLNQNLDAEIELLEIDAYIPSVLNVNGQSFSYLADKESFKTFTFYISNIETIGDVLINYVDEIAGGTFAVVSKLQIAAIYDLNGEYNFLDEIINYPKFYEIKKWLTIADIRNFEFFKQYYIRELNGSFFINRIKGFNPLSKQPTTIELIKISNKTPITPSDANPWVDGVQTVWEDGEGAYWY